MTVFANVETVNEVIQRLTDMRDVALMAKGHREERRAGEA